ncbi:hypothetical protein AFLA_010188 [Aspergillus flavus NRRL3357]|nr:hypothetical protein AFLA_010188 [Aspergillus flavus NRRL3357]
MIPRRFTEATKATWAQGLMPVSQSINTIAPRCLSRFARRNKRVSLGHVHTRFRPSCSYDSTLLQRGRKGKIDMELR